MILNLYDLSQFAMYNSHHISLAELYITLRTDENQSISKILEGTLYDLAEFSS